MYVKAENIRMYVKERNIRLCVEDRNMRMYVKAGNIRMYVEEWNICVLTIGIFFPSLRCPSSRLRIVAIRKVRVAAF